MDEAKSHMEAKRNMSDGGEKNLDIPTYESDTQILSWTVEETRTYAAAKPGRCVVVLDNRAVDVTTYLSEHVSRVYTQCSFSLTMNLQARRCDGFAQVRVTWNGTYGRK